MNSKIWLRLAVTLAGLALGALSLAAQAQVNATFTSKVFNPTSVAPGGTSVLTVTITNNTAAQLNGVTFTDTFPPGFISSNPNFVSGCAAFSAISTNGTSFSGNVNINASSSCIVTCDVTAPSHGTFTNTTANISGWNGNALAFAPSTLSVNVPSSSIPTLSEFALVLLALVLGALAYRTLRPSRSREGPPA
jgi:uncharacterized repeat protein (TIGR01451 family)